MLIPLLPPESEGATVDRAALRRMLSYVEAECRRIGAYDAAAYAALAAALVPESGLSRVRLH